MKLFGLTGGVGMGKSTAGGLMRERNVSVIDTDLIARELVEPGQPALLEIQRAFGDQLIGSDGRLHRENLAKKVFSDPAARRQLEAILHPPIRDAWQKEVQRWRGQGCAVGVVIIPLLFETDAAALFDATICVACSAATQWQRLRERGWSDADIRNRIEAQWAVEKKIALSTLVVWTDTTLEIHAAQLERILSKAKADRRA
jgi:dephospho-CoA kinase